MIDLAVALRAVVAAFEDAETDYVLVGSVAAAVWGVTRATRDVDLVAVLSERGFDLLVARLDPAEYYLPVADARAMIGTGGSFNVLHTTSGGKVDVFVVAMTDAFERSRMQRRIRADVLGVSALVASPEDVVLAKLRWRRETRSEVQWRDCVEIVAINEIDVDYVRRWAVALDIEIDVEDLLASRDLG